jgi:hypothetical protein
MSRNFPQALFALLIAVLMTGHLSATTYYIAANGSDSNNGSSKSTPWAHLPGMSTWTGSHTPVAGDTFILRGCDDWGNSNFPVNWTWSGTSGSHITIGVDQTWYNTSNCPSSWNRPKFDAGGAVINPPECTNQNAFFKFNNSSYVDVNWIELTGFYWASPNTGGSCYGYDFWFSTSGSNDTWNYGYIHNWTMNSSVADDIDNGIQGSGTMTNTVIDNSDGTQYTGIGDRWTTLRSVFKYVSNAYKPTSGGEFGYSDISHVGTIDPGGHSVHPNCIETVSSGTQTFWIHDNRVHDMPGASEQCESLQVGNTGETDYIWNNIWYNLGNADIIRLPQNNATGVLGFYFMNNTFVASGGNVCGAAGSNTTNWVNAFVMVNNHCITPTAPGGTSQSQEMLSGGTITGATLVAFSNNIVETLATANANGYTNSETFVYSPVSGTVETVGAGANLTSTHWPSGYSTNDTTYACNEQTVNGVVQSVCPARTSNSRPSSGAWDAGAYQFDPPGSVSPPSGLAAVVQ